MSGENQRDQESDFLDDDFIIEDLAAKNDDLDSLFEETPAAPTTATGDPDAEDVLFTDHSRPPTFEGKPQFAEDDKSSWDGQSIDLAALDGEIAGEPKAEAMAAAEQSFTKELDSLLKSEEEFGPDSDQDLEVIGADPNAPADGVSAFETSGPFVLDDGEGAWQQDDRAAAASAAPDADEAELESTEVQLGVPREAASGDDAPVEPGWEPLPAARVDDLAEVGEVERTEDEAELVGVGAETDAVDAQQQSVPSFGGQHRPALVGAGVAAEVEGHDIYAEESVAEVVGTKEVRRRGMRLLVSLAATLSILAAGAVIVLKPQWLGMGAEPERTQQVEVTRPTVSVTVPVPEVVDPAEARQPDQPTVAVEPSPTPTPTPTPTEPVLPKVDPVATTPTEPPPATSTTAPVPTVPDVPAPVATTPVTPTEPVATTEPAPPIVVPAPPSSTGWPVRETTQEVAAQEPANPNKTKLLRVNEELLIGEPDTNSPRSRVADGVLPGSRAFAQLANGNYFIGSVKSMDSERLTLNVDTGEVTLPVAGLVKLTELGSADYAELQRVTSGFVRLTNNNRLVGGILSGIADDHVVLEFRSNRVMLPRSAVGQVVEGEGDAAVRLDTTREEDDWLRRLVERQVGTGAPVPEKAPLPAPKSGAPADDAQQNAAPANEVSVPPAPATRPKAQPTPPGGARTRR